MNYRVVAVTLFALFMGGVRAISADGQIRVRKEGSNTLVQIEGGGNDDWRVQASPDIATWTTLTNFGTLLSGKTTNAPWRAIGPVTNSNQFYRALKTAGLYDPSLFRTVSLTFTQANWGTLLTSGRTTGSNVYCSLVTLDNGATNVGVGARYKGNTSFNLGGNKKSFNIELDWTNPSADLMAYTSFNLN